MVEVPRASLPLTADASEIAQFINAHGDRLLRSAFLLCGNETEAQDLAQETIIQAIKSRQNFRGDSELYTWLHGILLNLSRRHYRKKKRMVYDDAVISRETVPPAGGETQDREFCAERLAIAIQQLSAEHREVVVLRFYENMKIEDIASHTGISKGTVKSRLHYAVRCLEQLVPKEMNLFVSNDTHY